MNKNELAEKIRILRKRNGFRQEDLAAKSGVSIRVIKDIESATGNPTLTSLDLIASVLSTPLFQIVMPGMESINGGIVNAPQSIAGSEPHKEQEKSDIATPSRTVSKESGNAQRNEDKSGKSRKPPHEMSENINNVSHAHSSDTNLDNFSVSRPVLILEIQDLLKELSQDDLETLKMSAENLRKLSQSKTSQKAE